MLECVSEYPSFLRMNGSPPCIDHILFILASVDGYGVASTFGHRVDLFLKKDNFVSIKCRSKAGSITGGLRGGRPLGSSLLNSVNTGDHGVAVLLDAYTHAPYFNPHISSVRWAKLSQFSRDFSDTRGHRHSKTQSQAPKPSCLVVQHVPTAVSKADSF